MDELIAILPNLRGKVRKNASLAKMCWFGVGGEVDYLFQPADSEDLIYFLKNKPWNLPFFIFGVGSNMIVKDAGFRGVGIRLGREFNYIKQQDGYLSIGAGMLDQNVALYARDNSIQGFEFLSGVPGTIGGAIAMNAGAYGKEIKDVLHSVKAVTNEGEIKDLTTKQLGLEYRHSQLAKSHIFIEATFKALHGIKDEISNKIKEIQQHRNLTQPIKSKTGGSTFKNPSEKKAWELIDEAGCRGFRIGGAQVSEMHCNFFINTGNATAQDLLDLIQIVKEKVFNKSGIMLNEEIKIIG